MKTMWCSDGGVFQVEAFQDGKRLMVRAADGHEWEPADGDFHETEVAARRVWLLSEAAGYENAEEREERELGILSKEDKRIREAIQAAYRDRDKARDARAAVLAQLAELDAVEGRR